MYKTIIAIMLLTSLLSSCAPATVEPTATSTPLPAFTLTSTITLTPTLTLTPTITPTPGLPNTVNITIDEKIPENIASLAKTTVNQAYWFYKNMGCSPDFRHATFVSYESALTVGYEGILVGWDDLSSISSNMNVRISHEMFHVMCQLAVQEDAETGRDMLWLLEGNANYVVAMERLEHTGALSGVTQTIPGHRIGMAQWVSQEYCAISLKTLEQGDERKVSPDFGAIDEVAASLLAAISPDGISSFLHYYELRPELSREDAFEQAFGITIEDFYILYDEECSIGFPTIIASNPIQADLTPWPTPSLAAGEVRVRGNVVLNDTTTGYDDFIIVFCKDNVVDCLPGVAINSEGEFGMGLIPGKYRVSVNATNDWESIGWYTKNGLVPNIGCAQVIRIYLNQETILTIDLHPASC